MNLQPITRSVIEGKFPSIYADSTVGSCINKRPTFTGSVVTGFSECGTRVRTDTGFADLEGTPFKAYYCPKCAAEIIAKR